MEPKTGAAPPGPTDPQLLFEKARILVQQDRYQLAQEELQKLLSSYPDLGIAHSLLAICLFHQKRVKEAFAEGDRGISLDPENSYPYFVKALLFTWKSKFKEALDALAQAKRLDPESPDIYCLMSELYNALGNWQVALWTAEKGLEFDPSNLGCQKARTQALAQMGWRDKATASLHSSLAQAPDDAQVHAQRGYLLLEEGNYGEALNAFQESMRLDPTDAWAKNGLTTAMKARYPAYGWVLKSSAALGKLGKAERILLVAGFYLFGQGLQTVGEAHQGWLFPLVLAVLLILFSEHFFNLVLCLSPAGRSALPEDTVRRYQWFGGCLVLSLLFLGTAILTGEVVFIFLGVLSFLLVIPVATTFECLPGKARGWMATFNLFLVICGSVPFLIKNWLDPPEASPLDLFGFFLGFGALVGFFLSFVVIKSLNRFFMEDLG